MFLSGNTFTQSHPNLILTAEGVAQIKSVTKLPELFSNSLHAIKEEVAIEMEKGIDVPIPKDMGGGYTHERHKLNYRIMHKAGALFQITDEVKYANYIKDMLMKYADLFPTLGIHPTKRSYATGKIFWQCLNDANWMVYTAQAYDCIYDFLSEKERTHLNTKLFRPYADFISIENPKFFNRVHNHSTWGIAGVGLLGLVMGDEVLIDRALNGLKITKDAKLEKDNDGGFIYDGDKPKAGFFAQLDYAFSPDGYYTEGPYYQRYAMTPFMIFAEALENARPEVKIYEYRQNLLLKAVYALLYQTDGNGAFFPINDAQKGMSYLSPSVISAVNIAYGRNQDPQLLTVARDQGEVLLDQNGFAIAKGLEENKQAPFFKKSIELRDGPDGNEGALGILRAGDAGDELSVVFKYTAQGLGHGHYDKLSYSYYDGKIEGLQDYGAARWVNIDQKAGGRYLKENTSWAKQTIAHNTIVVDRISHFNGEYDIAVDKHADPYFFDVTDKSSQVVSAKSSSAYPGVELQRTLILIEDELLVRPMLVDIFSASSDSTHEYELPFQYQENLLQTDVDYHLEDGLKVMGENHGYQHLWLEAKGSLKEQYNFSWIKDDHFFTLTALAAENDDLLFARLGANDPDFNLRRDALIIHKKPAAKNALFVNVIESHGVYSRVSEVPLNPYAQMESVDKIYHDDEYSIIQIKTKNAGAWSVMIANKSAAKDVNHKVLVGDTAYTWQGPFLIQKIE